MTWTTLRRSDLAGGLSGHRTGSGPLMVLIHGVGLRAEAWGAMMPLLADHFTVLAVDMPGHGGSAPVAGPGLPAYTARFAALLETETPAFVVGHSMGAMIALDLAAQHPARVTGVAALNAIYRRSDAARQAVQARAASLATTPNADPAPTLARWFADLASPEALACRDWLTTCDPKGYATAYATFAAADGPTDAALTALDVPALFLTGANDANSTPAMAQQMAALAPRGRVLAIADAAHMAPMTHAAPIVTAINQTFGGQQ